MTAALVIVSVLAFLEFVLIVGVCQAAAADKLRREKAEKLLRAVSPLVPQGPLSRAIGKWLAHVSDDGGTP